MRSGADIEDLHQMRVAVRRMRGAALKSARPLLDAAWSDELRAELGWLGRALGPSRDLDVMIDRPAARSPGCPPAEQSAGDVLVPTAWSRSGRTARPGHDRRGSTIAREYTTLVCHP